MGLSLFISSRVQGTISHRTEGQVCEYSWKRKGEHGQAFLQAVKQTQENFPCTLLIHFSQDKC